MMKEITRAEAVTIYKAGHDRVVWVGPSREDAIGKSVYWSGYGRRKAARSLRREAQWAYPKGCKLHYWVWEEG